jgi:hypothetical protein
LNGFPIPIDDAKEEISVSLVTKSSFVVVADYGLLTPSSNQARNHISCCARDLLATSSYC